MLEPGERSLLLDTLRPPEGFELDEAIGTTFSLDLLSLLTVPLAFTLFDWEDAQGRPNRDPILILEALRRHMERITIFAQAGRTSAPNRPNPLFAYLEESVVEVAPSHPHGVFHPKLWVLRFAGPDGGVRYRLVCLTRNLTEDRSWDLSAVLEGEPKERQRAIAASRPLRDFVAALPEMAVRELSATARVRVERMTAELRRVEWTPEAPFEEFDLHPLGIPGYKKDPTVFDSQQALAISPFLSEEQVELFSGPTHTLVSRPEELDKIPEKLLKEYKEVLVLRADANAGGEQESEEVTGILSGLHAKCYVMDAGWNTRVFIGSANLTDAAFDARNVEFLLELRGKKSKLGVASFLDGDGGEASLRALLEPYTRPAVPPEKDEVAEALEKLVDEARGALARSDLRFVVRAEEGGGHRLVLVSRGKAITLPKECDVRVWPITLPEQGAGQEYQPGPGELDFGKVALSALTTFLGVSVVARRGGQLQQARFVLNLPLEGAPEDRREAVFRSILDAPEKVMRFLQFLLEEDSAVLGGAVSNGTDRGNGEGKRDGEFVILESLLRALTRDPARLDHVATLLKELGADSDAAKRLPKGLLDVWPAVWAAREELRT